MKKTFICFLLIVLLLFAACGREKVEQKNMSFDDILIYELENNSINPNASLKKENIHVININAYAQQEAETDSYTHEQLKNPQNSYISENKIEVVYSKIRNVLTNTQFSNASVTKVADLDSIVFQIHFDEINAITIILEPDNCYIYNVTGEIGLVPTDKSEVYKSLKDIYDEFSSEFTNSESENKKFIPVF